VFMFLFVVVGREGLLTFLRRLIIKDLCVYVFVCGGW